MRSADPAPSDARRPRLWIFNHYAGLPEQVPAIRPYELTRRLVKLGWGVTVIASAFSHYRREPDWRMHADEMWRNHERDGVDWVFLNTPGYTGNGLDRFRDMLAYYRLARRWARERHGPDIVVGTCVHPFAAEAARRIAAERRVPYVYEVTDLWPASLVELGKLKRTSPLYWMFRALERRAFRAAASVAGVLPGVGEYAEDAHGITPRSFVYVPNGFAEEFVPTIPPTDGEPGRIVYVGGFSHSHDLGNIVRAAAILERQRPGYFQIHLYGDGPARAEVEAGIVENGLKNVHLHGIIPKQQVPAALAPARVCLVTGRQMPIHRFGVSTNKMFDYFAAGKPAIFAVESSNNPVAEAKAGLSVPAGDPRALAAAIEEIDGWTPTERIEAGLRGRRHLLAEFGYGQTAARLDSSLRAIIPDARIARMKGAPPAAPDAS